MRGLLWSATYRRLSVPSSSYARARVIVLGLCVCVCVRVSVVYVCLSVCPTIFSTTAAALSFKRGYVLR